VHVQSHDSLADRGPKMINRLQQSRSPYVRWSSPTMDAYQVRLTRHQVRGHMNNPVAWQLWDAESISLAKKNNRLVFLSIGYSACHCASLTCPSYPILVSNAI
jgi:uncharacterized protein YyaL (SSP411 family)